MNWFYTCYIVGTAVVVLGLLVWGVAYERAENGTCEERRYVGPVAMIGSYVILVGIICLIITGLLQVIIHPTL